ncbi:MAG: DUF6948 domain-containing protein [bacterium]
MSSAKVKNFVIVRSSSAGCFFGNLVRKKDKEVALSECRRLWRWAGAASLSQLAVEGTSNPSDCKFPIAVPGPQILMEVIEIIPVTEKGRKSIEGVPIWKA